MKVTEGTNRNSVNMTDMAEATSKAASMASQTDVKVDELSATIGTAVARTKLPGNNIGTALKSLFINLQDTSSKKIVGTLNELGISQTRIVNGSKQLKTPIELLRELAKAYNDLPEGDVLKADVLRNIGMKRQANVLAAILSGISEGDFDKMLKDYSEGTGSAAEEAEKSANNIEGTLNKLSNTWTSTVNNIANSDGILTGVKALNSLLGVLNNITSVTNSIGNIGALTGLIMSLKGVGERIAFQW